MSGNSQTAQSTLENQAFALMGRIHILLRRETGRVTDIKYMSINPEYCLHVIEMGSKAADPILKSMCDTLKEIYFGESGLFGAIQLTKSRKTVAAMPSSATLSSRVSQPLESRSTASLLKAGLTADASDQHYVGRLR